MSYPATFKTVQDAVIADCRLDATADLAAVKDWINVRYADACIETGAYVPTATTTNMVAGTFRYSFPTGVERILTAYITPVGQTQVGPLVGISLDDLVRRQQGGPITGSPTHYAVQGIDSFFVWPTPLAVDVVTFYYNKLPTALSADGDVPIMHEPWVSKILFHGAAQDAATFKADWERASWHAQQYADWLKKYRVHLNRAKGTGTRQFRLFNQSYVNHDPSVDDGT